MIRHKYKDTALIFLTAFFARAVFFLILRHDNPLWVLNIGINGWLEIAQNLAAGDGYTTRHLLTYFEIDHLVPTAARSPLPVLVLSGLIRLLGSHYSVIFIYSWTLSAAAAVLLSYLSKKIFSSQKMGLITALLYCFYIPEMYLSTGYAAAAESLFTLLLMSYFWVTIKNIESGKVKWAFCAGLLLGLAFLCRPAVIFIPALYVIWIWKKQRSKAIPHIALFLTALLLCVAPWAIRNQMVFHKPIVTSTLGGYNLLRHHHMLEEDRYSITTYKEFEVIARKAVAEKGYTVEELNEVELDQILSEKAVGIIKRHPLRYLKLCAVRCVWVWYKLTGEKPYSRIQNAILYLLMFPGMLLVVRHRHILSVFVWHILFFVIFHALINVQFRFICPMMPYGIMIAVYAGQRLLGKGSSLKS